jgi:hypothetical protein
MLSLVSLFHDLTNGRDKMLGDNGVADHALSVVVDLLHPDMQTRRFRPSPFKDWSRVKVMQPAA